jgi:hypothetical protein
VLKPWILHERLSLDIAERVHTAVEVTVAVDDVLVLESVELKRDVVVAVEEASEGLGTEQL